MITRNEYVKVPDIPAEVVHVKYSLQYQQAYSGVFTLFYTPKIKPYNDLRRNTSQDQILCIKNANVNEPNVRKKVMFLDITRYAADQNKSEMYVGIYNPAKRRDL